MLRLLRLLRLRLLLLLVVLLLLLLLLLLALLEHERTARGFHQRPGLHQLRHVRGADVRVAGTHRDAAHIGADAGHGTRVVVCGCDRAVAAIARTSGRPTGEAATVPAYAVRGGCERRNVGT